MERFVVGAALATAGIFALMSATGGADMSLSFDVGDRMVEMGAPSGTGGSALTTGPQTFAAAKLRFEDGYAVVKITPSDRTDIAVSMTNAGPLPAPLVRLEGDTVVIDGELGGKLSRCKDGGASVRGFGDVAHAQAPQVTVSVPRAVAAAIGAAGVAEIGPSASADLKITGCASATIGDVAGGLTIDRTGSGHVSTGSAGVATINVQGAGSVRTGAIAAGLTSVVQGSGQIDVASLNGPLSLTVAGSADVEIESGAISAGSVEVMGSGEVRIGAAMETLKVATMGSGEVTVDGVVGALNAAVMGSGEVKVAQVTGTVERSVAGSGEIEIGNRQP
jgi:hypothetical protein